MTREEAITRWRDELVGLMVSFIRFGPNDHVPLATRLAANMSRIEAIVGAIFDSAQMAVVDPPKAIQTKPPAPSANGKPAPAYGANPVRTP